MWLPVRLASWEISGKRHDFDEPRNQVGISKIAQQAAGRPRTAEEFNAWFRQSKGDPWNYASPSITARLRASRDFLCRMMPNGFEGAIVELGAFDGSFTVYLQKAFPLAEIHVIDISRVAIEKAQQKVGLCDRVSFYVQDFLQISRDRIEMPKNNEAVILMLECLYYLKDIERGQCVETIRREFPTSLVIISVPVTGGNYFTEAGLLQLFKNAQYTLRDFRILNLRRRIPPVDWILKTLAKRSFFLRSAIANQVIFAFAPE
jgi:hypothetical protein